MYLIVSEDQVGESHNTFPQFDMEMLFADDTPAPC